MARAALPKEMHDQMALYVDALAYDPAYYRAVGGGKPGRHRIEVRYHDYAPLERQQVIGLVVRLEEPVCRHVVAGAERSAVRDPVLKHPFELHGILRRPALAALALATQDDTV